MELTPQMVRAARGLLDWTAENLAKSAGVSVSSLRNFEAGNSSMMAANLRELGRVLEAVGVEFLESPEGKITIRGPAPPPAPSGERIAGE